MRNVLADYNINNSSIPTRRVTLLRPKMVPDVIEFLEMEKLSKPSITCSELQQRLLLDCKYLEVNKIVLFMLNLYVDFYSRIFLMILEKTVRRRKLTVAKTDMGSKLTNQKNAQFTVRSACSSRDNLLLNVLSSQCNAIGPFTNNFQILCLMKTL